jgi:fatty-acyl-CoA synthase
MSAARSTAIPGLMQSWPLTLDKIIDHAMKWHPARPVVSRRNDGVIERGSYAELNALARLISTALIRAGVRPGDRVATLASNHFLHLATWYGIMGIGAVCHTLNPRLHLNQLCYIASHAGDRLIFADGDLLGLIDQLMPCCPSIESAILYDAPRATTRHGLLSEFVDGHVPWDNWGEFPEDSAAGLCYTSGTTGHPKGVLYSHRSNYLHTLQTIAPDAFCLSSRDVVMPVVPMYHANSWGLAFSAPAVGAKLVLPGSRLDGPSLLELIEGEGVTFSAGVPTVWRGLLDHCRAKGITKLALRRVVVGGSACPEALMADFQAIGVEVMHAWGMTELSPVGLVASLTPEALSLSARERQTLALKQGRPTGIDAQLIDDQGTRVPHDGQSQGRLMVRGPTVAERYLGQNETSLLPGGWFDTGDIATIDSLGYVRITDRAKDIIKSGGEWISSVDIENEVMGHPAVALAAVVAIHHDKWGERPKLFVQLKSGASTEPEEFRSYLASRIAKWWMPDEIVIIDAIPLGATGKIDKKALRDKP